MSKTEKTEPIQAKEGPVSIDEIDNTFLEEILSYEGGEHLLECYQCGICTSSCAISEFIQNPPHKIVSMAVLGLRKRVLSDPGIWICSYCHTCMERCPKGVDYSHLLSIFRNLSAKYGYIPKVYRAAIDMVYEYGAGIALVPTNLNHAHRIRKALNLPDIPRNDVDEVRKLMEHIKIKEKTKPKEGDEKEV